MIPATEQNASRTLGPLPIVIGVTGHRDIRDADHERLRAQVHAIFQQYQECYPHTPRVLMSGLAVGADQLAAEVAFEAGISVVAVLPMPLAMYEQDFGEADGSRARFRRVLSRAHSYIELPLLTDASKVAQPGTERDCQYEALGAYIVRHSQALIALWDGLDNNMRGGTACVVRFQLAGVPAPYGPRPRPLDVVDNGPIHHLIAPRAPDTALNVDSPGLRTLWPDASPEKSDEALKRLDKFNRYALRRSTSFGRQRSISRRYLIGDRDPATLPPASQAIVHVYEVADTFALSFQGSLRWQIPLLFGIGVSSALALAIYAHINRSPLWLLAYTVLLFLALGWFATRRRFESLADMHLECRALAEALRIQLFWQLGGLWESVADYYLRRQRGELQWIRHAARNALLPVFRDSFGSETAVTDAFGSHSQSNEMEFIEQHWIQGQRAFFSKRARQDQTAIRLAHWAIVLFLLLATACALTLLFVGHGEALLSDVSESHGFASWLMTATQTGSSSESGEKSPQVDAGQQPSLASSTDALIVLTAVFLLVSAATESFADKKAWAVESKQYERMYTHYDRASQLIARLPKDDLTARRELLRDIGREALAENADWVVLHRGRIPELLVSG